MKGRLKKETVVSDLHPQIFPLSNLFYSVLQGFLWAVCCSLKEEPLQRLKAECILPPACILFTEPSCWQHVGSRPECAPGHAKTSQGDLRRALDRPGVPTGSQRGRWAYLSSEQPKKNSAQPLCPHHLLPLALSMPGLASATGSSLQGEKPL